MLRTMMGILFTLTMFSLAEGQNRLHGTGKSMKEISATEKEVLEVVKKWNNSFEKNDHKDYFTYIHDDVTLFIPSSPYRVEGKRDDQDEFLWSLGRSRTKVHFFQELQPSVQVYGNTAVVTYHNRGAYGPDGAEQMIYSKETNVLVKEEGKWKIVHIHVSKSQ